jgi:hypothetical protein
MFKTKAIYMKFLIGCIVLLSTTVMSQAQITYSFTSNAVTATGAPTGITAGNISAVNPTATAFASPTTPSSGYLGATGGGNGYVLAVTTAFNTGTSTYFQFVLTPSAGNAIKITAINWGNLAIATSGPSNLSVRTSVDNYATNIATATTTQSATVWQLISPTVTPVIGNIGGAVTVRIYGHGGTGTTPGAGSFNWKIDDVKITAQPQTTASALGTLNYIPKFQSANSLTNSQLFDDGTNVGIGTASPSEKLHIANAGNIQMDGGLISFRTNGRSRYFNSTNSNFSEIFNSGTSGLSNLILADGTGELIRLEAGKVGIGTTTPSEKLDITGNLKFSGALMPNNLAGAAGQVLTSAGAGAPPTWQPNNSSPISGNANYIWNSTTVQPNSNFNISGNGIVVGSFSSPGSAFETEKFGQGAVATTGYSTAIGYNAEATDFYAIAIGARSKSGNQSLAIGFESDAKFGSNPTAFNTIIGYQSKSSGSHNTSLGRYNTIDNQQSTAPEAAIAIGSSNTLKHTASMLFGYQLTSTASNQVVFGSPYAGLDAREIFFGNGVESSATATSNYYGGVNIRTSDGQGTNIEGIHLSLKPGRGTGSAPGGDLTFATSPAGTTGATLGTHVDRMKIKADGKIGIGTNTPRELLDLAGNMIAGGNHSAYLTLGTNDNNAPFINSNINPIILSSNSKNALTIWSTNIANENVGAVGIGTGYTALPEGYRLAVAGNIIAEKVKVKLQSSGWPDYVFENNYDLPTLSFVEKYIKENKHLPNVPSATEVGKNGVDLGDNQAVLLRKIEELTLYIIEQNKKIERLEEEKNKLNDLQKQINELKALLIKK